jgi:DNA replication licensing factor MCM5
MDRQATYTLSLFGESDVGGESNKKIQKELVDFILEFHLENVYIYRYGYA